MAVEDHLSWIDGLVKSLAKSKSDTEVYANLKAAKEEWSKLDRMGKEDVFIYLIGRIVTLK